MAMTRDEIKEKVIDIVSEHFSNYGREKMSETTAFVDDLGADSLDIAEIVMEFEDEFDASIPETDQGKVKTIGDSIELIASIVGK